MIQRIQRANHHLNSCSGREARENKCGQVTISSNGFSWFLIAWKNGASFLTQTCNIVICKTNGPFPSYLVPLFQDESLRKTFRMKISSKCMKMNLQTEHIHMNGFTRRLVLSRWQNETRKWLFTTQVKTAQTFTDDNNKKLYSYISSPVCSQKTMWCNKFVTTNFGT